MKKLLRAVVAFVALSAAGFAAVPAGAADMPPSMPPPRAPVSYVPFWSWNGPYVGINYGYGFGTSSWTSAAATTGDFSINGGFVGGTAGYNWQTGAFVFGAETDIDWSGIRGSSSSAVCATSC
jgi:outer membrane immunogenic protein